MHIALSLLPAMLFWPALLVVVGTLATAIRLAGWRALSDRPERIHVVAGGAVACLLLWLLNIRMLDGMVFHLLGITTLTLAGGWCFAVLGGSAAVLGLYILQPFDWGALPASIILTVIVPASLSWQLARFLYRPSLRHPFVYILGAGFAGGGAVVLVLALVTVGLFELQGFTDLTRGAREYWPLLPLLMFSEGFINGMCIAALAIFYPDSVKTFDDDFYLGK